MELSADIIFLLFSIALVAGIVDTIAGGGGLLTIPVLLYIGLPPSIALATNKFQATLGTLTSSIYFLRTKAIDMKEAKWMVVFSFIASIIGALCILQIDSSSLETVIPYLLIIMGMYFLFTPNTQMLSKSKKISIMVYSITFAFIIGFYDGFFGPGTGSFFIISLMFFLGYNLSKATIYAKLLNFVSNLGALLCFIIFGEIAWEIGFIMIIGQIIGALIGSKLIIRNGAKIIKPLIVIISFSVSIKLLFFS